MGDLWKRLSYAHISASKMDSIYEKMAREELSQMLKPKHDMPIADYLEEAICNVDTYAKKMLKYADIGRATSDQRRFTIAYDVAELYLSRLTERLEKYEHLKNHGACG